MYIISDKSQENEKKQKLTDRYNLAAVIEKTIKNINSK